MGQQERGRGGEDGPPFDGDPPDRDEVGADYQADDYGVDDYGIGDAGTHGARRSPHARDPFSGPRERLNQAMLDVADRLDAAAERLDGLVEERLAGAPGPLARAGTLAEDAANRMASMAGYLRTHDADDVRDGLERRVREKPVHALLIAVAAGWVAGKIIR